MQIIVTIPIYGQDVVIIFHPCMKQISCHIGSLPYLEVFS